MKKVLLIVFIFCGGNSFAQAGEWTWISGDSTANSTGVYGLQGVPSLSNHPSGEYEPVEWKDKSGNFWIYGGFTSRSDLWKYNSVTNEWTWVKGNGLISQQPVYGIKRISNIANTPGYRNWAAVTWVDTIGNLWLFGGSNNKNDLWKYDIGINEWTWMSGDTVLNTIGIHGIQGVPSASNVPGSRRETCSAWTDSLNNLWLFGGGGYDDAGANGNLNDLMKYDISTNEWTWMSGSSFVNALTNYGTLGVSNSTNVPGARWSYTKWKDAQNNFWLMGGYDNGGYLSDVWKYDQIINEWTWMAGPSGWGGLGLYQTTCVFDTNNIPQSRMEQRSSVTDNCGRFWMFGGVTSLLMQTYLNDLWVFDPQQLQWNWLSGTNIFNQSGNYGLLSVSSPLNIPSSRYGAVAWWGSDNKFYLFGGYRSITNSFLCDLWTFTPDTNCVQTCMAFANADFTASNTLCPGTCTDFLNLSFNATSYQWSFPGASPDTSTATNPANICYANSGSYDVQLVATNANGSDTLLLSNYITVYPTPPPQAIAQSGDTLFANAGANSYQWYFNTTIISGATDYFYVAPQSGDYNVVCTDANGCEVEAAVFNVIAAVLPSPLGEGSGERLHPNPVVDKLEITGLFLKDKKGIDISIYNIVGEKVFSAVDCRLPTVDCGLFPSGMYYLEVTSSEKVFRSKFIKQ